MNYEKKYNDAVERAKAIRYGNPQSGTANAVCEQIFPELRESEDERIRKELVEAFNLLDIESSWNGIPVKSVLAWLEKQKEQKDCSDCSKHLEGYINGRADAENKLLSEYGIVISPNGELRMKPRPKWMPFETHLDAVRDAVKILADSNPSISVRLSILYDQIKKLKDEG